MDQDLVVNDELDAGRELVAALRRSGFEITVAFWAKPTDERWRLYLATPVPETEGLRPAISVVATALVGMPELGFESGDVRVIKANDVMAKAAIEQSRPKVGVGPFASATPRPVARVIRFRGSSLGGVYVDGAYIYPPPAAPVEADHAS